MLYRLNLYVTVFFHFVYVSNENFDWTRGTEENEIESMHSVNINGATNEVIVGTATVTEHS